MRTLAKSFIVFSLFTFFCFPLNGQNFKWLKGNGSEGSDWGYSVAVHKDGFNYISGWFSDTIQFGSETLICHGDKDIFLALHDSTGNFIWVRHIFGPGTGTGAGLCTDEAGHVYITGWFTESIHLGNEVLTSTGSTDMFVAMYSHAGNYEWARNAGGVSDDYGNRICLNIEGDVLVSGTFKETAEFNHIVKSSWGNRDIFIANYSGGGNVQWVRQAGGKGEDRAYGIASDDHGHIAYTGFFSGIAEFDAHHAHSSGIISTFIAWCNPAGEVLWVKEAGGGANDFARGFGIGIDRNMHIYNNGFFSGSLNFTDQDKLSATGGPFDFDIYLSKYDYNGNLVWCLGEGGNDMDQGRDLRVDTLGNIYTTGFFKHIAHFSGFDVTSHGLADTYVSKYNTDGQLIFVMSGGSDLNDYGYSIAIDHFNNAIIAGTYTGYCDFGSLAVNGFGNTDIMLLKVGEPYSFIDSKLNESDLIVYPNPATERIFLGIRGDAVIDHTGQYEVFESSGKMVMKGELETNNSIVIDKLTSGLYEIIFITDDDFYLSKFVKR